MKNNIVCSERAPLKAGAGRGERRKTIKLQPERRRCRCFRSRGAAASRHENFHEDKINLLEPIFDEASSLFLMVAATRQRLQRRGRALGAELTSNSTERGKTL